MPRTLPALLVATALAAVPAAVAAADLAGRLFRDRNGNGLPDPGEEGLAGAVELYGSRQQGGLVDLTVPTAADGTFAIASPDVEEGCYVVRVTPPAGFRLGPARRDCPGSDLGAPVGTRRYSSPRHLIDALRGNDLVHVSLGDSIAEPASLCAGFFPAFNATDYIGWLGQRLVCIAPGARTRSWAIGGMLTENLLFPAGSCSPGNMPRIPNPDRCDNVFDTIAVDPDLVTISIGGNDWLGSEPPVARQTEPFDPADVQASVAALLDARRNLQEILSTLASELPAADVVVNSVYDNRGAGGSSTDFHNLWIPIWNQMLRDVTWGQGERFQVAEVHPEYRHLDLNGQDACGEGGLICGDGIHPVAAGAERHLEKVWDALGGVALGSADPLGTTSNPDLLFAAEELLAVRFPTVVEDSQGRATDAAAALARDDRGARVRAGTGAVVVRGFDAAPAGITPSHVVVAVRYRTDQPPPGRLEADAYAFEAALDGAFAPPAFTVTGWNTVVPIVGAGSNAPDANALPSVPQWREVRALLSRNLDDDGRARGSYLFPVPGWSDIGSLAVRLRGTTRGAGEDAFAVEWDAAWIEVYGTRSPGRFLVYRSPSPVALIAPGNQVASAAAPPVDDPAPAAPVLFYAVDDGAGAPAVVYLTRSPGAVRITW